MTLYQIKDYFLITNICIWILIALFVKIIKFKHEDMFKMEIYFIIAHPVQVDIRIYACLQHTRQWLHTDSGSN